jgi:hypothetical protein
MVTREEFRKAGRRGTERRRLGPIATGARYDRKSGRIVVSLDSGLEIAFRPASAEGLERANASDLAKIEVSPSGLGLHFPKLDADLYLPALLDGLLGSRRWMAARLGAAGGSARSLAKAAASRNNGRLGGRPRATAAATNPATGDSHRKGAVRDRSKLHKSRTEDLTRRKAGTGRFVGRKSDDKPSKGVRKEK